MRWPLPNWPYAYRLLLFGQDHAAPVHVAHEMVFVDVAVAIGFLVAARRPARAMGMLSLVGIAAGLLVVTAVVDLMAGRTSLSDEAPHLLVVAGWLLLHRLAYNRSTDIGTSLERTGGGGHGVEVVDRASGHFPTCRRTRRHATDWGGFGPLACACFHCQ